jgi:hypothetical protein
MKSLRSTGRLVAARAARRSSSAPPKWNGSVSTDSAAAPPRSYACATSSTCIPSRIAPADGERRLCSAITEIPGRISASWNGRLSGRSRRAASSWERGTISRRRSTSSRVASTMRSSTLKSAPAYP